MALSSNARFSRAARLWTVAGVFAVAMVGTCAWFLLFHSHALQLTLVTHQGDVNCLAFGIDGKILATGGSDSTVRLWNLPDGSPRGLLKADTGEVTAVAFSPNGKLVATTSRVGTARVWEVATAELREAIDGHRQLLCLAFSSDSGLLAVGGADQAVSVRDVTTGKGQTTFKHDCAVISVTFAGNDRLLVSRTEDGMINVWALATGRVIRRFGETHIPFASFCLILGSDGKLLASNSSHAGEIDLWDVETGRQVSKLNSDLAWPIASQGFLCKDEVIVGTSLFGATMVAWNVKTGQLLRNMHFPQSYAIAVSADGATLASIHKGSVVRVWDTSRLISNASSKKKQKSAMLK